MSKLVALDDSDFVRVSQEADAEPKKKITDYNPLKGITFVLVNQLAFCLSRSCAKSIFELRPDITPYQFLELRAAISLLVNIIWINFNLKHVVWDSVTKGNRRKLLYKVIGGVGSVFLSFTAVYYFPLTYSTSMRNVSPFFALIFSAMCANEKATLFEAVLLTLMTSLALCFVLPNYEVTGDNISGGKDDML